MTTVKQRDRQERALALLEKNLADEDHQFGKDCVRETIRDVDRLAAFQEEARERAEYAAENLRRKLARG